MIAAGAAGRARRCPRWLCREPWGALCRPRGAAGRGPRGAAGRGAALPEGRCREPPEGALRGGERCNVPRGSARRCGEGRGVAGSRAALPEGALRPPSASTMFGDSREREAGNKDAAQLDSDTIGKAIHDSTRKVTA